MATDPGNILTSSRLESTNATRRSADLGEYIASVYDDKSSFTTQIFDHGICHRRPALRSGRINRILLYAGSFNPPHRGHESLLYHAFKYSQDIDVIAAIIFPLDDMDVEAKCRALGEDLIFTKVQRVKLWTPFVPHDWYWVFDRSERDWNSFRARLTEAITKDGFDLRFVALTGPDYIRLNHLLPWNAWDCEEIVVSDVSRPADFVSINGNPTRFYGCDAWKKSFWNEDTLNSHVMEQVAFLGGGLSLLAPHMRDTLPGYLAREKINIRRALVVDLTAVSTCHRCHAPEQTLRFVHSREKTAHTHTSSTQIRRILKRIVDSNDFEGVQKDLENLAICPEQLVQYYLTQSGHVNK